MGGTVKNPSYLRVCTHTTGHAEVCQVEYDATKISYQELLKVFWNIHDPTQKNRQGLDIGDQYRSIIFYHTEEQRKIAEESRKKEQKKYGASIVTEIVSAKKFIFYPAEEYHQKYLEKRGRKVC
ncbi:peptide-methionine (S)-S-oxide reductase MsrA [Candidatus Woesearchaeota archaeon]|nr:peptide-methionine (S)-S-oxide reductase MsrA [Candidatus Woesearchaeota archaeon]